MTQDISAVDKRKPLEGVRILDLTHAYSGPFCTMHLADQGAEVIKVEPPCKGEQCRGWAPFKNGSSGYFAYINRNKYGITLNLKTPEGKKIFKELVKKVDVVCENFRVGAMEKLGLGYDVLKEINPRLIYASISGFGLEGPRTELPCYDIIVQAMGGLMSVTGYKGQMTKVGPAIADSYSGTYLALGIVMALYQRTQTGLGRRLDVSMLDTVFSMLETNAISYTLNGDIPEPVGNRSFIVSPFDSFEAQDGSFVIACPTDAFFEKLCRLIGRPELADDPRLANNAKRCENDSAIIKPIISSWAKEFTLDELEKMFDDAGIPFGRILNIAQVCELDAIKQRNMLWTVRDSGIGEEIQIPGTPIKMHGCEDAPQRSAPSVGEHSEKILRELLNLPEKELSDLRQKGVI